MRVQRHFLPGKRAGKMQISLAGCPILSTCAALCLWCAVQFCVVAGRLSERWAWTFLRH
jgi:hypothetical protein